MEEKRIVALIICAVLCTSLSLGASVRTVKGTLPLGSRVSQEECLTGIQNKNSSISNSTQARKSNQDEKALTNLFIGQMQFSLDLFKVVYNSSSKSPLLKGSSNENIFLSPMSIYSALLLAYFGANNNTEKQMGKILGIQDTDKVASVQAYKLVKFTRQLMRVAGLVKYDFDIANRIYFNEDETVRPCMKEIFNEDIEMLDFAFQPEKARTHINKWVEEVTRDKIKDVVTPDTINANTRIALVNAAYFKGQWASQFKVSNTQPTSFALNTKENGISNMMFQKGRFRHAAIEELQANLLEMPFLGDDVSFFALLPEGVNGLDETINRLSLDNLRDAMSRTFPVTVEVGLPKFRIEQNTDLRTLLIKMGLTDMFDSVTADFSGFNDVPSLKFDAASHKAFIEVNEEGSEAAAATALVSFRMARPLNGVRFICDHPFLYFIYDNLSDSILFMGVYRNPK